jgi:hypothetical protein
MTESDEFPLRLIGEMFVQVKCRNKGVAEGKSRTMSFFHIVGGHLSENLAWPRACCVACARIYRASQLKWVK